MVGPVTADVAVVGLGAMGSAALYQLARRGVRAIGIDRFRPPHTLGSSHGETRITRQAIGEGDIYVPLARRSHEIWDALEAETGAHLIERCGYLAMATHDDQMVHHGKTGFLETTIAAARRHAIPHELLTPAEVRYRFPQFRGLTGNERCYFEPGGGYVRPERCIAVQLRRAAELGARILHDSPVLAIEADVAGVRITTASGSVSAAHVVVAAGAWVTPFLPTATADHIRVYRQVAHWLPITDPALFGPDAPVFIWHHGSRSQDIIYGFPPVDGAGEIKCASESYDTPTTPDADWSAVTPAEAAGFVRTHVAPRIAGVAAHAARSSACLYTVTDDGDFIIDTHPDNAAVTIVSACSGHGFKHSAAIGEAIALGAIDPAFSLGRFARR